jgi:ribosomal protein L1
VASSSRAKSSSAKGHHIKSLVVSSKEGPGMRIDATRAKVIETPVDT